MGVEHLLKFYTAQFNSRLRNGIEMSSKIDKNGEMSEVLVSTKFRLSLHQSIDTIGLRYPGPRMSLGPKTSRYDTPVELIRKT